MWWDARNGFAWCINYKVASSSLVDHMINIAGKDPKKYKYNLLNIGIDISRWRVYIPNQLYPLPSK